MRCCMTEAFWTPEKKADYRKLMQQREKRRKFHREYMKKNRANGKFIIRSVDGKKRYFRTLQDYKKFVRKSRRSK